LGSKGSASHNFDVIGRDLMSPDEVRKLDNKKCLIFVKGYDPVLDDKYRTYEKDEFRRATAMGPYQHLFITDETLQESRRNMYLDAPEDKYKSYYYQTEECLGLFEDTKVFDEFSEDIDEGIVITSMLPGYTHPDSMENIHPLFSADITEYVQSGGGILQKHALIGFLSETGKVTLLHDEGELRELFNEDTREKTPTEVCAGFRRKTVHM